MNENLSEFNEKIWKIPLFRLKKTYFGAAFLNNPDNSFSFVTPRANPLESCPVLVQVDTGVDVTTFECDSDERFFLHIVIPKSVNIRK